MFNATLNLPQNHIVYLAKYLFSIMMCLEMLVKFIRVIKTLSALKTMEHGIMLIKLSSARRVRSVIPEDTYSPCIKELK